MTSEQSRSRRWIPLALIALGIVALIVVIVMMISGGGHGPARHFTSLGVW